MSTVTRVGDWVVKTRPGADVRLFPSEARGLGRLRERGCRVPLVRYCDADGIVLEFLVGGEPDWEGLAEQLAHLHTTPAADYGLEEPVFIGPIPLPAGTGGAHTVWWEARMTPLVRASPLLQSAAPSLDRVRDRLQPVLEGPVWVHGDLWSGNVHMARAGASLIDPSCWRAERGVDLAMMTLFGGFPPSFWATYEVLAPIPHEVRTGLPYWRLYFVAVHVVLFGESYLGALRRELDALINPGRTGAHRA